MNSQPQQRNLLPTAPSSPSTSSLSTRSLSTRSLSTGSFSTGSFSTRIVTGAAIVTLAALGTAGCSSDDSSSGSTATSHSAAVAAPGASNAADKAALTHLDPKGFAERTKQQGVVVLDVRTPSEFAAGHLSGAKNVDVQAANFAQQLQSLDKSASYAVYCRSGVRSANAGAQMLAAGFTKVADLAGGYNAWTSAGNPTTTA